MKVVCDRAALVEALTLAAGVVPSRTPVPVLQCLRLSAVDGLLSVSATDTEIGLDIGVSQVDVVEEGEVLIPSDKLVQIIRSSDDATVTLETERTILHLKGDRAHFKIFGFDPKEFPGVRDFPEDAPVFSLTAEAMRRLVGRTLFATAVENSRYAISGVLIEHSGRNLRFVATDGRRLAVARGECEGAEGDDTFIVPSKPLQVLNKLAVDPDAIVRVARDASQVIFQVGEGPQRAVLSSNLVEGQFPPFEDVIPRDQDKRVTFESAELGNAVRRAALLTTEESKGVRMAFGSEGLVLSSRAPEMGEAEINVDLKSYEGDPIEIGFNPGYITDALKVLDTPEVQIELKAPNKPGVIKAGNEFTYVVMPVNLS